MYSMYKASKEEYLTTTKVFLQDAYKEMMRIRQFELSAEGSYLQGKIGGFFHSYIGQEAIQVGTVKALGLDHWYTATYRCHALALLLGVTENSAMAELYGKKDGCVGGRGGSMHFCTKNMTGGFGIVGGHLPIAVGAAFTQKYRNETSKISVCFLGDGACATGAFHESLNLASLYSLPCLFIIENNQWGMGTAVSKAIAKQPIAESFAPSYDISGYSVDGSSVIDVYSLVKKCYKEIQTKQKPIIIEVVTERFKGHSISDPGLYRTKEDVSDARRLDPLHMVKELLQNEHNVDNTYFNEVKEVAQTLIKKACEFAELSPQPESSSLEEDVFSK